MTLAWTERRTWVRRIPKGQHTAWLDVAHTGRMQYSWTAKCGDHMKTGIGRNADAAMRDCSIAAHQILNALAPTDS